MMTPEQLKEIEDRWNSNEVTLQTINDFNLLLAEVRRLNRMVDRAVEILSKKRSCPMLITLVCYEKEKPLNTPCPADSCWRKYLESEVADK